MADYFVREISELEPIALELVKLLDSNKIICFEGSLGAGKTTLIQEICRLLEVEGEVSSPTFALVNTYFTKHGEVYHFDLYRIKSEEELYDIGFEEYIDSGQPCFIEWPEVAAAFLPADTIKVRLSSSREGVRRVVW